MVLVNILHESIGAGKCNGGINRVNKYDGGINVASDCDGGIDGAGEYDLGNNVCCW